MASPRSAKEFVESESGFLRLFYSPLSFASIEIWILKFYILRETDLVTARFCSQRTFREVSVSLQIVVIEAEDLRTCETYFTLAVAFTKK